MPKVASANPPLLDPVDPVSRDVTFVPSKTPYDPRHMLEGLPGEDLSCTKQVRLDCCYSEAPAVSRSVCRGIRHHPLRSVPGVTTPEGSKLTGFFDAGTFKELLGRTAIVASCTLPLTGKSMPVWC